MSTLWQFIIKAALLAAAYFAPVKEVFFIMLTFVGADLITGVIASQHRHIPRSSRRMRKSVKKLCGYLTVVLLAFLIEKLLTADWLIAHRFVAAYICTVELLSILENLTVITGHPAFVKLMRLVRGKASKDDVIKEIIHEKNDVFDTPAAHTDPERMCNPESSGNRPEIGYLRHRDSDRNTAGHGRADRTGQRDDTRPIGVRQPRAGSYTAAIGIPGRGQA